MWEMQLNEVGWFRLGQGTVRHVPGARDEVCGEVRRGAEAIRLVRGPYADKRSERSKNATKTM